MSKNFILPCVDCITFPICLSEIYTYSFIYAGCYILIDKCTIFKRFFYNLHRTSSMDQTVKKMREIEKVFTKRNNYHD